MYLMFFLYTFSILNPSTKCLEYRCKVKKKYLIIFKINYKQKKSIYMYNIFGFTFGYYGS